MVESPDEHDLRIELGQVTMESIRQHPSPRSRAEEVVHAVGTPRHAEFAIYLALSAWRTLRTHAESHPNRECGGFLLGDLCCETDHGCYLEIAHALPAQHTEGNIAELRFTQASWATLHRQQTDYPGMKVTGWYHTHPGFGAFFSSHDIFTHRAFFRLQHQLGVVYDPLKRSIRCYYWSSRTLVEAPGWYLYGSTSRRSEVRTEAEALNAALHRGRIANRR